MFFESFPIKRWGPILSPPVLLVTKRMSQEQYHVTSMSKSVPLLELSLNGQLWER